MKRSGHVEPTGFVKLSRPLSRVRVLSRTRVKGAPARALRSVCPRRIYAVIALVGCLFVALAALIEQYVHSMHVVDDNRLHSSVVSSSETQPPRVEKEKWYMLGDLSIPLRSEKGRTIHVVCTHSTPLIPSVSVLAIRSTRPNAASPKTGNRK